MKLFFAHHPNGHITYANWPIQETGATSYFFDVADTDHKAVQEGTKDFVIEGGSLKIVNSTRKAENEAKKAAEEAEQQAKKTEAEALKKKLEKGQATLEEIQQALSKLL